MKLRLTFVILMVMLALSACDYQQVTETQQFNISEFFTRLVIISEVGDVKVQSGGDNATGVSVTAVKTANGPSQDEAQQYLDQIEVAYEVDNNTCTITASLPKDQQNFVYGSADLTIAGVQNLPLGINLEIGSIECDTMNGGVITNNVGDITVKAAESAIELQTDTGNVNVGDYSGSNFSLRTDVGNADIKISGSGTLDGSIKTETGDINCDISKNRSVKAEIKTDLGNITITGITDYTKSGSFDMQASFELGAADGDLTMETGTGDIEVNVE